MCKQWELGNLYVLLIHDDFFFNENLTILGNMPNMKIRSHPQKQLQQHFLKPLDFFSFAPIFVFPHFLTKGCQKIEVNNIMKYLFISH